MSLSVKALAPLIAGFMIAASAEAQLFPTWETQSPSPSRTWT